MVVTMTDNKEEVTKFTELLEKSLSEKKDYLIGHYGIYKIKSTLD